MNEERPTPGHIPPANPAGSPHPVHSIRLRGAWATTPDGTRTRHFGWPSALDPHERVWLVVVFVPGPGGVSVNGTTVARVPEAGGPVAADITPLLQPRNELVLPGPGGGEIGDVALEVRAAE